MTWGEELAFRNGISARARDRVAHAGAPVITRLNAGWNADPNDPDLRVVVKGGTVALEIRPNRFANEVPEHVVRWRVVFKGCTRYRLTHVNDHGWYGGQCRFSDLAPAWGDFYEITGDTMDDLEPEPWVETAAGEGARRHFHFYLRDETFECKARDWRLEEIGEGDPRCLTRS